MSAERRGDYGYDAPYGLALFLLGGALFSIAAGAALAEHRGRPAALYVAYALFFLANAASFYYTTRRGKLRVWEEVLDGLRLSGAERVLDVGCGRGAVLTAVARRLTTGSATGVDLWKTRDQSGNARDVTLKNAALEGVAERVTVETGDMRALPFPDGAFDLVVSSLAIHNIPTAAARAQAVREAYRVLRPGGRLAIADIRATSRYAATLRELGAADVVRRPLGWRFWYGNPIAATCLVTATKNG